MTSTPTTLDNPGASGPAPAPGPPPTSRWEAWSRSALTVRGLVTLVLLVVVLWVAATTDGFVSSSNGRAILASTAFTGLVAIGLTLIMVNGNLFSLSLGSTLAVSAMAYMAVLPHGLVVAVVAALLVGAAMSGIQGWVIGIFSANPIIVTLASATLASGIAGHISNGRSLTPPAHVSGYSALSRTVGGIPVSVIVMIVVAAAAQLWLSRTVTGRRTFLVGTSRPAAVAAGLPVVGVTTIVFAAAGVTAAIAGVLLASLNDNATLSMSGTYNYDAIAAAVVGGAAVAGGRGSVVRTLLGALFITTVGDLVLLRGNGDASTGQQILAKGIIVVIFVLLASRSGKAKS